MARPLPMSAPSLDASDLRAVSAALRSGRLALGPRAEEFERRLAARLGARHAVAVSSGSAALHLAVRAAGIGRGDEVVTTPFSFVASANAFVQEGARPRFVDVDPDSLMPPADAIAAALTRRTRAILTVDLFGNPADADPIRRAARRRGIPVIEDACEALGAEYKGRPAGTLGDAGAFGFYPNKQLTTGEGGMLVTDRADWAAAFRSLRNQGRDVHDAWLEHSRLGHNYRLGELAAALGVSQLRRLDRLLAARARVAASYTRRLAGSPAVEPPRVLATTTKMSWFVYAVRLERGLDRDRVMERLARKGVPSRAYFGPIHLQRPYRERFGFRRGQFPVTEDLARRTLALPFHGGMTEAEVERVVRALSASVAAARRR